MQLKVLRPARAPIGKRRLLAMLADSFADVAFTRCRIIVAFAKKGGVGRLLKHVAPFRAKGHSVSVIVGVDLRGTSAEALELLLAEVDDASVVYDPDPRCTFHPKMFLFDGPDRARAFVGSHNATSGGLELNYEAGVCVDLDLPADNALWTKGFERSWDELQPGAHPCAAPLTKSLIDDLVKAGLVVPEKVAQWQTKKGKAAAAASGVNLPFSSGGAVAATPLESKPLPPPPAKPGKPKAHAVTSTAQLGNTLLIEVVPKRNNSEVFLSKTAINQNPDFWGFPWTGLTTPKKGTNKAYAKRDPHPKIRVVCYDANDAVNTDQTITPELMLYHNADVRMTVGMALVPFIPDDALLAIKGPDSGIAKGLDFEIESFTPGSPKHAALLPACNQTMPSGGKPNPRRFGWL